MGYILTKLGGSLKIANAKGSSLRYLSLVNLALKSDSPLSTKPFLLKPPDKMGLINWPKVENWGWRGVFLYLMVEAVVQQ